MTEDNTSRFVEMATFVLNPDEGLFAGDPCYIEKFINANLDDTANNHDLLSALLTHDRQAIDERGITARVFAVESERGNRALVLTLNPEPPIELLETILVGRFYYTDYVNVDSGLVGFYGGNFLSYAENIPLEDLKPRINGFFTSTYMGDGTFPVAVWAINGRPYTFAILTDYAYFDPSWQR
jgi:hypothetical protein